MTNIILLLASVGFSTAILGLLWRGDPKRRRVAGLSAIGPSLTARRTLAIAALLPGVVLAGLGDSAAFLIWLGSCTMAGWVIAQLIPRQSSE